MLKRSESYLASRSLLVEDLDEESMLLKEKRILALHHLDCKAKLKSAGLKRTYKMTSKDIAKGRTVFSIGHEDEEILKAKALAEKKIDTDQYLEDVVSEIRSNFNDGLCSPEVRSVLENIDVNICYKCCDHTESLPDVMEKKNSKKLVTSRIQYKCRFSHVEISRDHQNDKVGVESVEYTFGGNLDEFLDFDLPWMTSSWYRRLCSSSRRSRSVSFRCSETS